MEFFVEVLRVNDRKPLPDDLRKNLLENARYVRRFDVWLFEGDWETELWDWIDEGVPIVNLGTVILETTAGSEAKLCEEIEHLIPERKAPPTTDGKEG